MTKDEGVFVLNTKNYDEAIKAHQYILVYFYAPWCGHCKALSPGTGTPKFKNFHSLNIVLFSLAEYVKAAQILKDKDSPIKLAKVEGPEESDLLEKMHVTGYPTLFFYRDGEPIKYAGNEVQKF